MPEDTMTAKHVLQISLPAVAITFQLAAAVQENEDALSGRTANTLAVLRF